MQNMNHFPYYENILHQIPCVFAMTSLLLPILQKVHSKKGDVKVIFPVVLNLDKLIVA